MPILERMAEHRKYRIQKAGCGYELLVDNESGGSQGSLTGDDSQIELPVYSLYRLNVIHLRLWAPFAVYQAIGRNIVGDGIIDALSVTGYRAV